MKFNTGSQIVVSTGEIKRANMEVNAKSFSVLAGLYSDTIKAVVREYSTNALDEHIESGNPNPFDVHLPTYNEPYFYVRDYGRGLSQEEFLDVYLTFFRSSKDNSNDVNGCLGLGSKVLFADTIGGGTVETWKNGEHCIYDLFIGESGTPDYTLLSKKHSNEPNGVKVKIPVKTSQHGLYESAAKQIYRYFERKPNFLGKSVVVEDVYKNKITDDFSYDNGGYRQIEAVMGNVSYPIDYNESFAKYRNIFDGCARLILFFDIGEISFSPNREAILYNNARTIKAVENKLNKVARYYRNEISKRIDGAKNEWKAIIEFTKINKEFPSCFVPKNIRYKNKDLSQNINFDTLIRDKQSKDPNFSADLPKLFSVNRKAGNDTHHMFVNKSNKYVIDDLPRGAISRCRELLSTVDNYVYLLSKEAYDLIPYTKDIKDFILASSLPQPTKKARNSGILGEVTELSGNSHYVTYCWKKVKIENVESNIYVVRDRYDIRFRGNVQKPNEVKNYIDAVGLTEKVYGIKQADEAKFIEAGWKKLDDIIEEKTKNKKDELDNEIAFLSKMKTIYNELYCKSYYGDREREVAANLSVIKNRKENTDIINNVISLKDFYTKNESKYKKILKNIDKLKECGIIYDIKTCQSTYDVFEKLYNKYEYFKKDTLDKELIHYYLLGVDYASGNN